jgi:hypothetical protein
MWWRTSVLCLNNIQLLAKPVSKIHHKAALLLLLLLVIYLLLWMSISPQHARHSQYPHMSLECLVHFHNRSTYQKKFFGTGAWTQALRLEPLHQPIFVEIGSWELVSWAGFKLQSSWSLPPPELLGS